MFVFSNLATSLDGKIGTADRSITHLGSKADLKHMLALRRRCDAILFGASTLRTYRKPAYGPDGRRPLNVILSSRLAGISPRMPFFADATVPRLLAVTGAVPRAKRRAFEGKAEILRARGGVPEILRALAARGVRRLLVEGGGTVMWEFVSRDLIDEYHITLTPQLIGGTDSPTLVDGAGFPPRKLLKLRLARVRRVGDELFLTYRR